VTVEHDAHDARVPAAQGDFFSDIPVELPAMTEAGQVAEAESIDGAALLEEIENVINGYMFMPKEAIWACVLYAAATYTSEAARIAPRLAILSPQPQCGKTNLTEIMQELVWKPLVASAATGAAISRSLMASRPPTLVLDEIQDLLRLADSVSDDNSNAIAYTVLKAGYKRPQAYRLVSDKESLEPKQMPVFSFAVMAGKTTSLPDQLRERTIHVYLERKPAEVRVQSWNSAHAARLADLRERLQLWVEQHAEAIASTDIVETDSLTGRDAEIWSPLHHVAQAAGGVWPSRYSLITESLREQVSQYEEPDLPKLALRHVSATLLNAQVEFMPTQAIIDEMLNPAHEWPWVAEGASKTKLTAHKLAFYLRQFGLIPSRAKKDSPKGYYLTDVAKQAAKYI
jgi:hypothetical protein